MLETDEVDIDYFTPASGTSLASIFSSSQVDSRKEASLKYVPPLPKQFAVKQEATKSTQCIIYASAFHVYEWSNNTHVPKGKLGFAIMKLIHTGIHNMVIYNSEKTTLSCVTLNPNVTLNIDREHRISYYDSNKRYWSIYTTQSELQKIVDIMEQVNVQLKYSTELEDHTQNSIVENIKESSVKNIYEDGESDTDSSFNNKQSKNNILKRMATMGQSVLPPSHVTIQTSDSSDSNEGENLPKIRHKPFKIISRKHVEKKGSEDESKSDTSSRITATKPITTRETINMINVNDQQIVPIRTWEVRSPTNIVNDSTMNIYMSEQRVTNSELRLNMNKMSDKIDVILDKVKDMKSSDSNKNSSSSSFQNEIVSKLLGEYENKIKKYEEFLKLKGFDTCTLEMLPTCRKQQDVKLSEESNLDIIFKTKDGEISHLRNEVQRLSAKCEENTQINNDKDIDIEQEISNLRQELLIKNDEIKSLANKLDKVSNENNKDDFKSKLKEVMNDTFQTISRTFDSNETYSGTNIKNVVASVIKRTTMNALINE